MSSGTVLRLAILIVLGVVFLVPGLWSLTQWSGALVHGGDLLTPLMGAIAGTGLGLFALGTAIMEHNHAVTSKAAPPARRIQASHTSQAGSAEVSAQLKKLIRLRELGVLNPDEFAAAMRRVRGI